MTHQPESSARLAFAVAVAVVIHLIGLSLLMLVRFDDIDSEHTGRALAVDLTFETSPAPTPIPIEPDVRPIAAPTQPSIASTQSDSDLVIGNSNSPTSTVEPPPIVVAPTPVPIPATRRSNRELAGQQERNDTNDVWAQFSRYSADDQRPELDVSPEHPDEVLLTRSFGPALGQTDNAPMLPFEDPDTDFVFYEVGLEGGIDRAFDRISVDFGFKNRFGFEVKCSFILVIVACGWK